MALYGKFTDNKKRRYALYKYISPFLIIKILTIPINPKALLKFKKFIPIQINSTIPYLYHLVQKEYLFSFPHTTNR